MDLVSRGMADEDSQDEFHIPDSLRQDLVDMLSHPTMVNNTKKKKKKILLKMFKVHVYHK